MVLGSSRGSRELWRVGGVTEGRAQCQEGPYGKEASDLFPDAQEQSPATTCSLGLLRGCKMVPKLPSGTSSESKSGWTCHLGPSGINRPG